MSVCIKRKLKGKNRKKEEKNRKKRRKIESNKKATKFPKGNVIQIPSVFDVKSHNAIRCLQFWKFYLSFV